MKTLRFFRSIVAILLVASFATVFFACNKAPAVRVSEMTLDELRDCVTLGEYKNIELTLDGRSKESAIISHIMANSCVKKYPVGTVEYYLIQLKKQYRYYAEQAGMRYEAMLDELGEDNFTMRAEATRLVKQDMILEFIRKQEGITLTDSEKSTYFDRYVLRYAEKYGYDEGYVRNELSDLVYDSMLYDKTIEFLIINNTFKISDVENESEGTTDSDGAEPETGESTQS